MKVESKKASSLKRPATLRRSGNGDLKDLKANVKRLGLLQPVIVDKNGTVIIGERRRSVAKALGIDVPTVVLDLDETKRDLVRLAEEMSHRHQAEVAVAEEARRLYEKMARKDKITVREFAQLLGVNAKTLNDRFKLADLPEILKTKVKAGEATPTAAVVVNSLEGIPVADKAKLVAKIPSGRAGDVRRAVDAIRTMTPMARKSLTHNRNVNFDDALRASERAKEKAERDAGPPKHTAWSAAIELRWEFTRRASTWEHEGLTALVSSMPDDVWKEIDVLLLRIERIFANWRKARREARDERKRMGRPEAVAVNDEAMRLLTKAT